MSCSDIHIHNVLVLWPVAQLSKLILVFAPNFTSVSALHYGCCTVLVRFAYYDELEFFKRVFEIDITRREFSLPGDDSRRF